MVFLRVWLWPICQRYNLKAIHNSRWLSLYNFRVVTNMSKIQSESNSQLFALSIPRTPCCDQYVKDTIWKQFTTIGKTLSLWYLLWPICQRYNLKAIHNGMERGKSSDRVVTNMSKIQSESNSQLNSLGVSHPQGCDQYVKDTIWKQFTTRSLRWLYRQ